MIVNLSAAVVSLLLLPSALASALVPRRNTPNFYLVATTADTTHQLKAVKDNLFAASLSTGTPLKFYLDGEGLAVDTGSDPNAPKWAFINSLLGPTGCTVSGQLRFATSHASPRCARYNGFYLSSYDQNSQLGAKLVFNWTGSFYACPDGRLEYSDTVVAGCALADLWTVPATV